MVEALATAGFYKINFTVGEPTLCPWLTDLIQRAKKLEFTTSMVTNGSCVTWEWLDRVDGCLDWEAVSIDTVDPKKLKRMGRTTRMSMAPRSWATGAGESCATCPMTGGRRQVE